LEYICVFEHKCTLHLFSQIYSNLTHYKMKWNIFSFNILLRLYSSIICKNMWNSLKSLKWNTFKHAHPWENSIMWHPKRTIECFHPQGNSLFYFTTLFPNVIMISTYIVYHLYLLYIIFLGAKWLFTLSAFTPKMGVGLKLSYFYTE